MQVTGEFHLKKLKTDSSLLSGWNGYILSSLYLVWRNLTGRTNIYVFLKSISPSGFFQENHLCVCNHCDYCVDPLKPPVNVIVLLI